jgi:hypothetical protein
MGLVIFVASLKFFFVDGRVYQFWRDSAFVFGAIGIGARRKETGCFGGGHENSRRHAQMVVQGVVTLFSCPYNKKLDQISLSI